VGKVDQKSGHLNDAQVEHYGERGSGSAAGPDQNLIPDRDQKLSQSQGQGAKREPGQDQEIETHLAECSSCRTRVLASLRSRLKRVTDQPVNTVPRPDCPSEAELRNLAAGLFPPEKAPAVIQHAAQCDHCGPILRMYTEDFDEELSLGDEILLRELNSRSTEWRKKLLQKMGIPQKPGAKPED
jgi:hypothetical protein